MDQLYWRFPSRIVAIVDLILLTIGIFLLLLNIYVDVATQEYTNSLDLKSPEPQITVFLWTIIVLVSIFVIIVIVLCIWADIMLLKATKKGADHVDATKKARIWLKLNIGFFVMTLLKFYRTTHFASMVGGLVIRGILIFIVYKFTRELKQVTATPGFSDPGIPLSNL